VVRLAEFAMLFKKLVVDSTTNLTQMNPKIVNICPIENCGILGGSLFQKIIKKGKAGRPLRYYYFEHRNAGGKSVSHYIGRIKPRIRRARVEMVLMRRGLALE
jgi:hypothetical protein